MTSGLPGTPGLRDDRRARTRTRSVGVGVLILGLTTYAFFIVTSRRLSPDGFAGVSVVYTLLYTAGAGLLQPVEAHLSRTVAAAEARGEGSGNAVVRIAATCALLIVVLVTALLSGRALVADAIFAGDRALVDVSAIGLLCFAVTYVVRGVLAGLGRFVAYSLQLGLEGGIRVAGALVLSVTGVESAVPYALLVAGTPTLATVLVSARSWSAPRGGRRVDWTGTVRALGWLSACGVTSQLLANAGPLLVAVLAAPEDFAEAGRFMAALVLIRIPLFLFSAAQAVLVPTVAAAMAVGKWAEVRRTYVSLGLLVGALALANTVVLTVFGPQLLALLFGPAYVLGRVDLLLLGVFAAAQVHAQLSYQTLLGLGLVRSALVAWCLGLAALALGCATTSDLARRVEVGLVLGAATAAVALGIVVHTHVRRATRVAATDA